MAESCVSCGIELADGARFCRGCGARVEQLAVEPTEVAEEGGEQLCSICQFGNAPSASFCRNCGNSLYGDSTPVATAQSDDGGEPSGWLTAWRMPAAIGLAALLLVGATYFGWQQFKSDDRRDTALTIPANAAASSPATVSATGYFRKVEIVGSRSKEVIVMAELPQTPRPADLLKQARMYCSANFPDNCTMFLAAFEKGFPAARMRELIQNRESEEEVVGWIRNGVIVGIFEGSTNGPNERMRLNCDILDIASNGNPFECIRLPKLGTQTPNENGQAGAGGGYYVVAEANIRNRPTASSGNKGKIARGTSVGGAMILGEDGESSWFELAGGAGFVSAVNLSQSPPPRLATMLGDREFRTGGPLPLHASPSVQSAIIETVPSGVVIYLVGITDNGYVETKGRKGGVGYFSADGVDLRGAAEAAKRM